MLRLWWRSALGGARGGEEKEPASLDPEYLVKWEPNDALNPQNWSVAYKWWVTFQLGMLALVGSLGSSIITPADAAIARYVSVSDEVAVLNLSLYM
jgi:hypothetical protein